MKDKMFDREKDYSIQIIRDIEGIAEVRPQWEALQWHPYTDIDYFIQSSIIEENFIRPHILVLKQNGNPSALIIGRICQKKMEWKLGYKKIFKSQVRALEIGYGGILGEISTTSARMLVKELLNCLAKGEADIAFLDHPRLDSEFYKIARTMPNIFCQDNTTYENAHRILKLPDSFEEFYKNRSRNTKENIRRYRNRIEKQFGNDIRIKCFTCQDQVAEAMRDIEAVAGKTYHRGMGVGFHLNEENRCKWEYTADRGLLKAYVLYIQGEPRAFWNILFYKNVAYSIETGFDPQFEYYHPGSYLLIKMIDEFCASSDCHVFDFGFGEAEYKRIFGSDTWLESCVNIFAPTFRGLKLKMIKIVTVGVSQVAIKILKRYKALEYVKRAWRSRLATGQIFIMSFLEQIDLGYYF